MNKVNDNNKTVPLLGLRMFVSGILIFLGTLSYLPQSGMIRTLPVLAILTALGDVVYNNKAFNCMCAFVFSFCMLSVNGMELVSCLVYSAFSCLVCYFSIKGLRLLRASYKTQKREVKRKCIVRSVVILAFTFALYMLVCGNIISGIMGRRANHEYIEKNYGENVKIGYTSFDALDREYRTYVTFTHDGAVVGDSDDCFVSGKSDNIRDYYEAQLLEEGKRLLRGTLSGAVDMFEVTNCGIYFDKSETIQPEMTFDDFKEDCWYVISLYHVVNDKEAFGRLYEDCTEVLSDFHFKEIIICAGNATEVLYTATVTKENGEITVNQITDFDERYLEKYGVTEKTVLDYWYNR